MERFDGAYTFKELYEKACEYGVENCPITIRITDKFHKFQTSGYITDENLEIMAPSLGTMVHLDIQKNMVHLDIQKNVEPYEP